MSKPVTYLSSEFLISHGVPVTKSLCDWLDRASYVARTRMNEADQRKYERWAVGIVEDTLREPGGIEGKDWCSVSPVMPTNAVDRELTFFRNNTPVTQIGQSAQPACVDHRALLLTECIRRAPSELRSFVMQAFNKIDTEVTCGRRKYDSLTFMEIIHTAQELQRMVREQQLHCHAATWYAARQGVVFNNIEPLHDSSMAARDPATRQEDEKEKERTKWKKEDQEARRKNRVKKFEMDGGKEISKEAESRKVRRVEGCSQRGDPSVEMSSMESARTRKFFKDLVSHSTLSLSSRPFVGHSREMERTYSRYEPTSEDIRPRDVLVEALDFILSKAKEKKKREGSLSSARYLNEQFKGMRQDLRVQNIVDEFAIDVYEKHALICLKLADIGEFNQCQASLKKLYEGLPDTTRTSISDFFCYRLAYLCLGGQYDALATELISYTNTIAKGSRVQKGNSLRVKKSDVQTTVKLCNACEEGDCLTIGRSLMALPHGMFLLVKIFLPKCRLRWLRGLLSSMRGMVSMRFIVACLGFTPVDGHGSGGEGEACDFWLDGSFEEAEEAVKKFFEMIKFSLPESFSFAREISRDNARRHYDDFGTCAGKTATMVDTAALFRSLDEYITYLGTRRDARVESSD